MFTLSSNYSNISIDLKFHKLKLLIFTKITLNKQSNTFIQIFRQNVRKYYNLFENFMKIIKILNIIKNENIVFVNDFNKLIKN